MQYSTSISLWSQWQLVLQDFPTWHHLTSSPKRALRQHLGCTLDRTCSFKALMSIEKLYKNQQAAILLQSICMRMYRVQCMCTPIILYYDVDMTWHDIVQLATNSKAWIKAQSLRSITFDPPDTWLQCRRLPIYLHQQAHPAGVVDKARTARPAECTDTYTYTYSTRSLGRPRGNLNKCMTCLRVHRENDNSFTDFQLSGSIWVRSFWVL